MILDLNGGGEPAKMINVENPYKNRLRYPLAQ